MSTGAFYFALPDHGHVEQLVVIAIATVTSDQFVVSSWYNGTLVSVPVLPHVLLLVPS